MANPEHLDILKQGVEVWNRWVEEHLGTRPVLRKANLAGTVLTGADLTGAYLWMANLEGTILNKVSLAGAHLLRANLYRADLREASLERAVLREANLQLANLDGASLFKANLAKASLRGAMLNGAKLRQVDLTGADLVGAVLQEANLNRVNLYKANLTGADLRHADLSNALLIETNLEKADLTGCAVYGISAWGLNLEAAKQSDLVITPDNEPTITVDNLEVAQFLYVLLRNEKIRHVIDTITSKVVLILGRFTPERKAILDAIRDELRRHDLLPVLFDFQKPESQSFIETVSTLAHMARFVIADMTEPRIVLQEVPHIVQNIAVPLVPLLLAGEEEPVTLYDLRRNHRSVLPTYRYRDRDDLLMSLEEKVIIPAQTKVQELRGMR